MSSLFQDWLSCQEKNKRKRHYFPFVVKSVLNLWFQLMKGFDWLWSNPGSITVVQVLGSTRFVVGTGAQHHQTYGSSDFDSRQGGAQDKHHVPLKILPGAPILAVDQPLSIHPSIQIGGDTSQKNYYSKINSIFILNYYPVNSSYIDNVLG